MDLFKIAPASLYKPLLLKIASENFYTIFAYMPPG
jgi:hypothetical protein